MKKAEKVAINYLTVDAIKLLLEQPDRTALRGRVFKIQKNPARFLTK